MRRFRGIGVLLLAIGTVLTGGVAQAQHLYFTTRIPPNCPIVLDGLEHSKDFGFQAVIFRNDSSQTVESIRLNVTLSSPQSPGQVVDSGHIYLSLEPGDTKRQDVFLGRMQALLERAREDHLQIARALIEVESVDFADGSRWSGDTPVIFEPLNPVQPPRPQ